MLSTSLPSKFPLPFAGAAASGDIRPIPEASQISITPGAASLTDGFPPLNFVPVAAGGVPPFGQDMNGILNQITAWVQWQNAQGPVTYDATFSAAIGGYPKGALLTSATGGSWWLSTIENNTTDPDSGGAGWTLISYGQVYAGNPNGNVAGTSASSSNPCAALLWDSLDKLLWICSVSGTASTAVWLPLANSASNDFWCGTSSGTGNAQIINNPMQSLVAGMLIAWKVGASQSNTGATTIKVGTLGTYPLLIDGVSGPVALSGGELVSGNLVSARFGGTDFHLVSVQGGSASTPIVVGNATTPDDALNTTVANSIYLQIANANANFAKLNGNSSETFSVAYAAAPADALPLGQAYEQLSITANQPLTLTALETLVFSNGLTSNITITLEPGTIQGQTVCFMSGTPTTYSVTVNSNVTSGSPAFYFPDGTSTYSFGPTDTTPQGSVLYQWDGTNWHCQTTGQVVVAPATASNQAVNLGQSFSGGTLSNQTANRSTGGVYTNTSGRPRFINAVLANNTGGSVSVYLYINGGQINGYTFATGATLNISSFIPLGATYEVGNATGGISLTSWYEWS